jgi:hypothetical protein
VAFQAGKPALAFRFSLLPLQRTCANGRWLRSLWNLILI